MATQPQSPLLALPQELQDRIFRFHFTIRDKTTPVLVPRSCMFFYKTLFPRVGLYEEEYQNRSFLNMHGRPSFPHSRLALLLVCRKIYRDFQHIFYLVNDFCFSEPSILTSFLTDIGAQRRRYIRSVELKYWTRRDVLTGLKLLASSEHLEQLVVHVSRNVLPQPKQHVLEQTQLGFWPDEQLEALRQFRYLKTFVILGDFDEGLKKELQEWLGSLYS